MKSNISFYPYSTQSIDEDDISEVVATLKSDYLTQGPRVNEFEDRLAHYCGARFAVAFNSGTSALHAAYYAGGLRAGDEFITSPLTFVSTSNAGLYRDANPVFADIESDTGNIDAEAWVERLTKRVRLIVPVHYAGQPVDMERLSSLAKDRGISIVEDACHALGASYKGARVGCCKYSDMAVMSFHPVKPITTGEGGAVLTNNEKYYEQLKIYRTHGISKNDLVHECDGDWYYEMRMLGYNYRMPDINAALGISQLRKLDGFITRRRELVKVYEKVLMGNPYFDVPVEKAYARSSYHLYPIRLKDKYLDKKALVFKKLRDNGLGVQVHYIPVYWHPYYNELGFKKGLCPNAEDFYRREISIPLHQSMTMKDLNVVKDKVMTVFEEL